MTAPLTDAQAAQPAESNWTYKVQYGPEGEANYAWLYRGTEMVATMRTHHATTILALLDEREGLRMALEPFAKSAIDVSGTAACGVTLADIENARSVYYRSALTTKGGTDA